MCAALAYDVPLDRSVTTRARQVGAAIDLELLAVAAHPPLYRAEIRLSVPQRGSEILDPLPQDFADGTVQRLDLSFGQGRSDSAGV